MMKMFEWPDLFDGEYTNDVHISNKLMIINLCLDGFTLKKIIKWR